jgi:hypothetical protein
MVGCGARMARSWLGVGGYEGQLVSSWGKMMMKSWTIDGGSWIVDDEDDEDAMLRC